MTVLELLIGLAVAGGIVAIAVPTVKHQQVKAQERQSRAYLKVLSQAQRQYYVLNQSFAQAPSRLEVKGKPNPLGQYEYSIAASEDGRIVTHKARSRSRGLRSQVSVVSVDSKGAMVKSLLCKAEDPANSTPGEGKRVGGELLCPVGYSPQEP